MKKDHSHVARNGIS